MIRTALLVAAVAAVAAPAVFAAPADAGERLIPALTCVDRGGATVPVSRSLENRNLFGTASVFCAIERENVSARPLRIEVTVKDENGGNNLEDNIACRVGIYNTLGIAQGFGDIRRTSGIDGAQGRVLSLQIPAHRIGFYGVTCELPRLVPGRRGSQFGAIRVVEPD